MCFVTLANSHLAPLGDSSQKLKTRSICSITVLGSPKPCFHSWDSFLMSWAEWSDPSIFHSFHKRPWRDSFASSTFWLSKPGLLVSISVIRNPGTTHMYCAHDIALMFELVLWITVPKLRRRAQTNDGHLISVLLDYDYTVMASPCRYIFVLQSYRQFAFPESMRVACKDELRFFYHAKPLSATMISE